MDKKKDRLEIIELFMAKAGKQGWNRCFHGTIRREIDKTCKPIVFGKILINDGHILASATDQWELGDKLDELVLMILDFGLHSEPGKTSDIAGTPYFQN